MLNSTMAITGIMMITWIVSPALSVAQSPKEGNSSLQVAQKTAADTDKAESSPSKSKPRVIHAGPFEYENGLILTRVVINDAGTVLSLIDTHSARSAIHQGLASKLEIQTSGQAPIRVAGRDVKVPLFPVDSISLFGATVYNLEMVGRNTKHQMIQKGSEIGLILGMDFLKDLTLRVDFERRQLEVLDAPPPCASWGIMKLIDDVPHFDVVLDGDFKTTLRLDTTVSMATNDGVYLNLTDADQQNLLRVQPGIEPSKMLGAVGPQGRIEIPVYQFGFLRMGSLNLDSPYGSIYPSGSYGPVGRETGFFTCNLLEKFRSVVMDFRGKRLGFDCQP
ncbi:MAG: retropepsin-like aspartic protease [Phycisphaerae bacterium]